MPSVPSRPVEPLTEERLEHLIFRLQCAGNEQARRPIEEQLREAVMALAASLEAAREALRQIAEGDEPYSVYEALQRAKAIARAAAAGSAEPPEGKTDG